jgi:hypothetical protein
MRSRYVPVLGAFFTIFTGSAYAQGTEGFIECRQRCIEEYQALNPGAAPLQAALACGQSCAATAQVEEFQACLVGPFDGGSAAAVQALFDECANKANEHQPNSGVTIIPPTLTPTTLTPIGIRIGTISISYQFPLDFSGLLGPTPLEGVKPHSGTIFIKVPY